MSNESQSTNYLKDCGFQLAEVSSAQLFEKMDCVKHGAVLWSTCDLCARATTLVDQMLHMLSKYADNLEELVEERTTQLEMEQKKTEELLCRMLPKWVNTVAKVVLLLPVW